MPTAEPGGGADDDNRGRGRPAKHAAAQFRRVTVILLPKQINFLDRAALGIQEATGQPVHRAEIIRAAVDALAEAGPDLSAIAPYPTAEGGIKAAIIAALCAPKEAE